MAGDTALAGAEATTPAGDGTWLRDAGGRMTTITAEGTSRRHADAGMSIQLQGPPSTHADVDMSIRHRRPQQHRTAAISGTVGAIALLRHLHPRQALLG